MAIIEDQLKRHPGRYYVFPSPRRQKRVNGFLEPMEDQPLDYRALAKAIRNQGYFGLPCFAPKSLRHTVKTKLAELGILPHINNRILNHSERGMDRVYQHNDYLPEKRQALRLWAEYLLELEQTTG